MTEPRWIAYELHDGLMQWVIGARMHLSGMLASIKEQQPLEDLESSLSLLLSYLNQAAEEGRHLIRFVEGLEEDETTDAVQALAATCIALERKARDGKPRIEFNEPTQPWPLMPPQRAWQILRIVQQATINAIRHSGGQLVRVVLGWTTDLHNLSVCIEDDGHGFDPHKEFPGHFGLKSMRQRAKEAGFDLTIQSSASGTTIELKCPVSA